MHAYPGMTIDYILYRLDYRLAITMVGNAMHMIPKAAYSLLTAPVPIKETAPTGQYYEDLNWEE